MLKCKSLFTGKYHLIKKGKVTFRPSVYAVVKDKDSILLIHTRDVYFMPGGHVNIGEKVEDALKREVHEETGLDVQVEKFIKFYDKLSYHDKKDEAHHKLMFIYLCSPINFKLSDGYTDDGYEAKPEWIKIDDIAKIKTVGLVPKIIKLIK